MFQAVRRNVMLNAKQTPQYADIRFAGHEGGDFLFVRKEPVCVIPLISQQGFGLGQRVNHERRPLIVAHLSFAKQ